MITSNGLEADGRWASSGAALLANDLFFMSMALGTTSRRLVVRRRRPCLRRPRRLVVFGGPTPSKYNSRRKGKGLLATETIRV